MGLSSSDPMLVILLLLHPCMTVGGARPPYLVSIVLCSNPLDWEHVETWCSKISVLSTITSVISPTTFVNTSNHISPINDFTHVSLFHPCEALGCIEISVFECLPLHWVLILLNSMNESGACSITLSDISHVKTAPLIVEYSESFAPLTLNSFPSTMIVSGICLARRHSHSICLHLSPSMEIPAFTLSFPPITSFNGDLTVSLFSVEVNARPKRITRFVADTADTCVILFPLMDKGELDYSTESDASVIIPLLLLKVL